MTGIVPASQRRVTTAHYNSTAIAINVPIAALRAVVDVEARGSGFDNRGRPKILFEKHIMYRVTKGAVRDRLVKAGLAATRWRPGRYPKSSDARYAQLAKAQKIAGDAAYKAISMGLPQILGTNHAAAGYKSAKAMFDDFSRGVGAHLLAMAKFIAANPKMHAALRRLDWAGFASRYNGPGYRKNRYDEKLAEAYRRHSGGMILPTAIDNGLLDQGDKGAAVKALQFDLVRIGFDIDPDGDFGRLTDQAVREFQIGHGLKADGIAGSKTLTAIASAVKKEKQPEAVNTPIPPAPNPVLETVDIAEPVTPEPTGIIAAIVRLIAAIFGGKKS